MTFLIYNLFVVFHHYIYWEFTLMARWSQRRFPTDAAADFVVSIASYPKRDGLLPAVFQGLSRQRVLPKKWVLVLSLEDYPKGLPQHLLRLERRGLHILWVENNPYAVKKLLPVMEHFPELAVVTLDDDMIYQPYLLQGLLSKAKLNRGAVIGYVGRELIPQEGRLGGYYRGPEPTDLNTHSEEVYLIGWGGIYYPASSLDPRAADMAAVHRIVPGHGADVWFWAAAHAQGTQQICLGIPQTYNLGVPVPLKTKTAAVDRPRTEVIIERFQMAIEFFGIKTRALDLLPERAD